MSAGRGYLNGDGELFFAPELFCSSLPGLRAEDARQGGGVEGWMGRVLLVVGVGTRSAVSVTSGVVTKRKGKEEASKTEAKERKVDGTKSKDFVWARLARGRILAGVVGRGERRE